MSNMKMDKFWNAYETNEQMCVWKWLTNFGVTHTVLGYKFAYERWEHFLSA